MLVSSPLAKLVSLTLLGSLALLSGCAAESTSSNQQDIVAAGGSGGQHGPGGKADNPNGTDEIVSLPDAPKPGPDTKAMLVIYHLNIWAQPLDGDEDLQVSSAGQPVQAQNGVATYVPLSQAADYQVDLSAPDYEPISVGVSFNPDLGVAGTHLNHAADNEGAGISFSHQMADVHGTKLPAHLLFLGLRHKWFSAEGRPARRGNALKLYMSGEDAWKSVHSSLKKSHKSVLISTWWWESNFELVRGTPEWHAGLTEDERWDNTILGVLEQQPTFKRVLVGQFWGQDSILSWMTTDSKLRKHAKQAGDDFEFMGMANETEGKFYFEPTPIEFGARVRDNVLHQSKSAFDKEQKIHSTVPSRFVNMDEWPVEMEMQHASYHQKFMVIDDDTAFIGGMNLRRVDWDTTEHKVYDERRELFGASSDARQRVLDRDKLPDNGPRKDYMVRIQGPAAQDAADVFKKRWDHQLDRGVTYADKSTPFEINRNIQEYGDKQVQVTATMPQPFWEHAIAETWFNAVRNAENYIYIEDQYFRIPMLDDVIIERMNQVPRLKLVVITKPVNEWSDPGCVWTAKENQRLAALFPKRYMLLQLRAFDYVDVGWGQDETDGHFLDMDTHSKMLMVDDKFMSVGSANKNNRGLVYEGELNVAVLDHAWVTEQRHRIFANILPKGTSATNDVNTWWDQLKSAAAHNDAVRKLWKDDGDDISLDGAPLPDQYKPEGFVYSLSIRAPKYCAIEGVGPDMVTRDSD